METIHWQALDTNNFNVFIRDLSSSMNINLKHMIEDMDKKTIQSVQKKHKKSKKPIMKKKDIIIQQQNQHYSDLRNLWLKKLQAEILQ